MPQFTVQSLEHGQTLHEFLMQQWPQIHRVALRQIVQEGMVEVNGMDAGPQRRLREGDYVDVQVELEDLPEWKAPEEPLHILAENEFVVVIDKPSGAVTVPDRKGTEEGVWGDLPALRPGQDLRIVHRLDRATSGCLLLAKGLEVARHLDQMFQARKVLKRYTALVHGVVLEEGFTVSKWLGPDRKRPGKVVTTADGARGARDAETEFEVVERFRGHTLVSCLPRTGRGHQIRVHLQSHRHPIVGDADYGGLEGLKLSDLKPGYKGGPGRSEPWLLHRMFLHAASLETPMPDGSLLNVQSPLPGDLELTLQKLRRFAAPRRRS